MTIKSVAFPKIEISAKPTAPKPDPFEPVRVYAKARRKADLNFNSEHLKPADNVYVGWLDLMGAGHIMGASVRKSANFLTRLHMAVHRAVTAVDFKGRLLTINDGVFIVTPSKRELMSVMGRALILLSCDFVAVPRPHDRFLMRGGIAYGPVYFGGDLIPGLAPKKLRENAEFLLPVMFGPPIIQAYRAESFAPPFGVAVHESARAFFPPQEEPFRMTHWLWWAPNEPVDYPRNATPLPALKDCLAADLDAHFTWMADTLIFHGVDVAKLSEWRARCVQYFAIG
jgi:hypothetical protein